MTDNKDKQKDPNSASSGDSSQSNFEDTAANPEHIDVDFKEAGFHDLEEFSTAFSETNDSMDNGEPIVKSVHKHHSKRPLMIVLVCVFGVFLVTAIFSAVLYMGASSSGQTPSILSGLGISTQSAMSFVYLGLSMFFSLIGLLSLVGLLVSIFKFLNTKPEKKQKKKRSLVLFASSCAIFLISIVAVIFISGKVTPTTEFIEEEPIQAAITTTPENTIGLIAPIEIEFEALNLGLDLEEFEILSYNWDFDDGATASGPSVVHTFKTKPLDGIFNVELDVKYREIGTEATDPLRLSLSKTVTIENIETAARFSMTPDSGQAPLEVDFDASLSVDPDGSIVRYEWDFDGDTIIDAEGVKTSFKYLENGDYNVSLFLTDNNGQTTETSRVLSIKGDEIFDVVIKTSPADEILAPGRSYQFDASRSKSMEANIVSYEWNFGDGRTRVGQKVSYEFKSEGNYVVSLDLRDENGNTTSLDKEYTVSKSPSGIFINTTTTPAANAEGIVVGEVPLRLDVSAAGSSGVAIVDYSWDFENDGIIDASGRDASYTYVNSGEYKIKLTLTASNGKQAHKLIRVSVEKTGLMTKVSAEPSIGEVPLTVDFDATSTKVPQGINIVAFRWDFGDGTPILRDGPIVTHKFTKTGDFKVAVTAITDENETDTTETLVFVNEIALNSCFNPSRNSGQAPLVVQFNPNCTTGVALNFSWDFGTGDNTTDRKPTYTFENPGEYEVVLEVSDSDNNVSKYKETITVE